MNEDEKSLRHEKDRGDHRHHAIDALIVALITDPLIEEWKHRIRTAGSKGFETEEFEKLNPLKPPRPWDSKEQLQKAIRQLLFDGNDGPQIISHRPTKRKIIGHLHFETLYGTVIDHERKRVSNKVTIRQDIYGGPGDCLKPQHLKRGREETEDEAVKRLYKKLKTKNKSKTIAEAEAQALVKSEGFKFAWIDPSPGNSGLVRDRNLRDIIREALNERHLDPNLFTAGKLKESIQKHGPLRHKNGAPIHRVVLIKTKDPVVISRWYVNPVTGKREKLFDADDDSGDVRAARLYDSQSNHHIEVREDEKGKWTPKVCRTIDVARSNAKRLREIRRLLKEFKLPNVRSLKKLSTSEQAECRRVLSSINSANPLVDRRDIDEDGGKFVMSIAEGETIFCRRWDPTKKQAVADPEYFVVAKLGNRGIVLVPHWDGRPATGRKDADKKKVPHSSRDSFEVTVPNLRSCGPNSKDPPYKLRVSPLGEITLLVGD